MNYSSKVKKYYDGMQIYETLIEDELAIYLIFALGFKITNTAILKQIDEFIEDFKHGIIREIPDYDVAKLTILKNYFRTGKLKFDMEMLKDKTVMERLKILLGSVILEGTSADLYDDIVAKTKLLVERLEQIDIAMHEADPAIFGANFFNLMARYDWTDTEKEYQKEKNMHCVSMRWLQEKQEQELQKVLDLDIMHYADEPSMHHLESVDYQYHRSFLPCKFQDSSDNQVAYAKMMQYAARKGKLLLLDFNNYGKYIALNFFKFRPEQKQALFEIVKKLELIQKDMVRLEPELGEYLNNTVVVSLEDTEYYAPYRIVSDLLRRSWFEEFRTSKDYSFKWRETFTQNLFNSEMKELMVNDWRYKSKRLGIQASIIGGLKEAGVIEGSDLRIASAIVGGSEKDSNTFARYMGRGREKKYAEWIINYVKQQKR